MANVSRRASEKDKGLMSQLRVTSDVGQVLPNGNYVPAHEPTEIMVYEYQVPVVISEIRTSDEMEMLEKAKAEYEARLADEKAKYDNPEDQAKVEKSTHLSVEGVQHSREKNSVIHPLLLVEQQMVCSSKQCGEVYYDDILTEKSKCPSCLSKGNPARLPPPKAAEKFDEQSALIERILPKLTETITASVIAAMKPSEGAKGKR